MRLVDATAAGRRLHTWNDLLSTFPNLLGVKTGHTNGAGWSQVAAARGGGVTIYATLLGGETREGRNADLSELLAWGLSRYRTVWAIDGGRTYGTVRTAYGKPAGAGRRREAGAAGDPRRAAARRARRPSRRGGAARAEGAAARRGAGARPRRRDRALAARGCERRRAAGYARTRRLLRGPNARPPRGSLRDDRHRHAERSARPHAHRAALPPRAAPPGEPGADARGRQGDQRRAGAEAARRPGRRDRARGRPHGHADRRGADRRGDPERLRPHRRGVANVDRRRRPDRELVHRDQRVGAEGHDRGARDAAREAALPLPRRRLRRLRGLAAARRRGELLRRGRSAT